MSETEHKSVLHHTRDQQSVIVKIVKIYQAMLQGARDVLLSVWEVEINNGIKHKAQLPLLALFSMPFWRQELVDMWIPQSVHFLHDGC